MIICDLPIVVDFREILVGFVGFFCLRVLIEVLLFTADYWQFFADYGGFVDEFGRGARQIIVWTTVDYGRIFFRVFA